MTMRDKLIEAASRAMCARDTLLISSVTMPGFRGCASCWKTGACVGDLDPEYIADATAALDAILTVLREPSEEMRKIGMRMIEDSTSTGSGWEGRAIMHLTYRIREEQMENDRPALEIEITEEMIEAGAAEIIIDAGTSARSIAHDVIVSALEAGGFNVAKAH